MCDPPNGSRGSEFRQAADQLNARERAARQQGETTHFQIHLLLGPDGSPAVTSLPDADLRQLSAALIALPLHRADLDWDPDALRRAVEAELSRRQQATGGRGETRPGRQA